MDRFRSAGPATIAALMVPATATRQGDRRPEIARGLDGTTRRCERAVVIAYRDLRQDGTEDLPALRACATLYRIHHPEASEEEASRLVAAWISHHVQLTS